MIALRPPANGWPNCSDPVGCHLPISAPSAMTRRLGVHGAGSRPRQWKVVGLPLSYFVIDDRLADELERIGVEGRVSILAEFTASSRVASHQIAEKRPSWAGLRPAG